jgi:probable rRNA maturation factor
VRVDAVTRGARHGLPRRWVERVGRAALRAVGFSGAVTLDVALVDDATIAAVNRRFLRHRGPTDVITFPAAAGDGPGALGEVVISVDRARAQARRAGWRMRDEIVLLLVHGILHLAGYDDRTPRAARRMREAEARAAASVRRLARR